jgi:hypothetical protein
MVVVAVLLLTVWTTEIAICYLLKVNPAIS